MLTLWKQEDCKSCNIGPIMYLLELNLCSGFPVNITVDLDPLLFQRWVIAVYKKSYVILACGFD